MAINEDTTVLAGKITTSAPDVETKSTINVLILQSVSSSILVTRSDLMIAVVADPTV